MAPDKWKLLFHDKVPYFAHTKLILTQASDTMKWELESWKVRYQERKRERSKTKPPGGG